MSIDKVFVGFSLCLLLAACRSDGKHFDKIHPELYYYKMPLSNWSFDDSYEWRVGNSTADGEREQALGMQQVENQKIQACYDAGNDTVYHFDIINDYNLSCAKLAYINDHLVDNYVAKNGGYISSYYHGLLSSKQVEVHLTQWVNERVAATGQLVDNITIHTDCNNASTVKYDDAFRDLNKHQACTFLDCFVPRITYYSTADFVMYYTERCIE